MTKQDYISMITKMVNGLFIKDDFEFEVTEWERKNGFMVKVKIDLFKVLTDEEYYKKFIKFNTYFRDISKTITNYLSINKDSFMVQFIKYNTYKTDVFLESIAEYGRRLVPNDCDEKNEIFVIWSQDYEFLVLGSSVDYCKCLKIDEDVVTSKMIEKIRETIGNKEINIVNDLCGYV